MDQMHRSDPLTGALRGAIAGVAATWLMGKATSYLYQQESKQAREQEEQARGGKSAYGVAADKVAGAVGRDLSDEERKQAGSAIHWALGAGAGAVYGALRERFPAVNAGAGTLFGTAFFLLVDEAGNTLLGLTPAPDAFPWQAHARGLAGHLVFGAAEEAGVRLLDAVT